MVAKVFQKNPAHGGQVLAICGVVSILCPQDISSERPAAS
jgi:hypothetical protein